MGVENVEFGVLNVELSPLAMRNYSMLSFELFNVEY